MFGMVSLIISLFTLLNLQAPIGFRKAFFLPYVFNYAITFGLFHVVRITVMSQPFLFLSKNEFTLALISFYSIGMIPCKSTNQFSSIEIQSFT